MFLGKFGGIFQSVRLSTYLIDRGPAFQNGRQSHDMQ